MEIRNSLTSALVSQPVIGKNFNKIQEPLISVLSMRLFGKVRNYYDKS